MEFDALAITDEIYEHILYDGARHVSPATIDGMAERTITINGMSKTYSVTGWRVGWTIAPADLTLAIRKVHDFLTVGAAAPLQAAGAVALGLPRSYYLQMAAGYRARRDQLLAALRGAGLVAYRPRGAYYIMTDVAGFHFADDVSSPGTWWRRSGLRGAGLQLLQPTGAGLATGALCVLQDARRRWRAATERLLKSRRLAGV